MTLKICHWVFVAMATMLPFNIPVHAQPARVFVAAQGADTNPCTFAQPCRSFQRAHDIVGGGGEIDVLDAAGYGTLTINKSISIQGHGFAGLAVPSGAGITVNAASSDKISLRGLLIDGLGSGGAGVDFSTGGSLDVEDCVIRNFALHGLQFRPSGASWLLVANSHLAANAGSGILVYTFNTSSNTSGAFDHVVFDGNAGGLTFEGSAGVTFSVSNSVISNSATGVYVIVPGTVALQRVVLANHSVQALYANGSTSTIRISKSMITGNQAVFDTPNSGQIWSYGDNIIDGNANNNLPQTTPLH